MTPEEYENLPKKKWFVFKTVGKIFFGGALSVGLFILLSLLLVGCGSSSSDSSDNDSPINRAVEGVASKGIISGGWVTIYAVNADGTLGDVLGTAQTGSDGKYSIDIGDHDRPVVIEVTGGLYTDEATGVTTNNTKLRAFIPPVNGTQKAAVTPLTEIAVQLANSTYTLSRINNANAAVSILVGGADITETQPPDIEGDLSQATDEEKNYAILLAAISQMIEDGIATDVANAITMIKDDLADDGELTVEMGILQDPSGLGILLQAALGNFIASAENNTGLGEEDITVDETLGDAFAQPYFFEGDDSVNGPELWVSDGTEAGTYMLKDIRTGAGGSYPMDLNNLMGTLIFWADDGTNGIEPWVSDGTEAGTFMVTNINPGAGDGMPYNMMVAGNKIYCRAKNGTDGFELWVSDGTAGGTFMLKDINPGADGSVPMYLTEMGGKIYFNADDGTNGAELWVTDGTAAGTKLVKDICVGTCEGFPMQMAVMDDKLYFSARTGTNDIELWVSDGTEAGTTRVKDINPGTGYSVPRSMTLFKGKLYFEATDGTHGYELWTTNGTEAGTYMVKDIRVGDLSGISSGSSHYTEMGGELYFTAYGTDGYGLWVTDGTEAGTKMVHSVTPTPSTYESLLKDKFTNMGGKLYFFGSDATYGAELWVSDGTEAGTKVIKDINPGAAGSFPWDIINIGGKVYFGATDGTHGTELWASDGTEAGTHMVKDVNPGAGQGYLHEEEF